MTTPPWNICCLAVVTAVLGLGCAAPARAQSADPPAAGSSGSGSIAAPAPAGVPASGSAAAASPGASPEVSAARDAAPEPPAEKKAALRLGITSNDAPVNIASEKLEMVPAPNGGDLIRFRGGVRLDQGDLELTCDLLDAYYAQGQTGRPKKIVATGSVRMKQLDMRLSCQRATFVDDECIAVCESNLDCQSSEWPSEPAVLQRETNTVSGRLLEFDLCTGELTAPCGAKVELRDRRSKPTREPGAKPEPDAKRERGPTPAGQSKPAAQRKRDTGPQPEVGPQSEVEPEIAGDSKPGSVPRDAPTATGKAGSAPRRAADPRPVAIEATSGAVGRADGAIAPDPIAPDPLAPGPLAPDRKGTGSAAEAGGERP